MSLSDALEHINEAGLLLQRASKALSEAPIPPPYEPVVGDVISLTWNGGWAAIVVGVDHLDTTTKMFDVYLDLDRSRRATFFSTSQVHRSVKFLRKATVAEMIAHGLKEKDVAPKAEPDTIIGIKPWMLADDHPMVARIYGTQCVYVTRGILWSVTIDRGSGLTNESAQCHDKEQAMRVAEGFMGCGPLVWRRAF